MSGVAQPLAAPARSVGTARAAGRLLSSLLLLASAMALVAVVVAGAAGMRVRVEQTGSMAPALVPGDLVLMRSTPVGEIRPGDVIGVRDPSGRIIVHRVERIDGEAGALRVRTRGDANPTGEEWRIARTADVALVRGTLPRLGAIVDAARGPLAALAVLFAGLLLAVSALRAVWRRP